MKRQSLQSIVRQDELEIVASFVCDVPEVMPSE